jgi:catechol 2,3-dioxygenase-like lactoylglutathione lyase family enzyme/predicted enzyme related to lactoylglutathione lyase
MTLIGARIEPRLPAFDLDRARTWYRDKLGLEPVEQRPGALRYATAGGVFCLFLSAGHSDGSFTQLCLEVDDLATEVDALRSRGVAFHNYQTPRLTTAGGIVQIEGNYPSKGTGELAAWFHDSENNLIGLAQTLPTPRPRPRLRDSSILLGTSDPDRLQRFYQRAFDVAPDSNGWLQLGTIGVKIDPRQDVGPRNQDPGRVVLNIDTEDAAVIVARLDALGVRWLCPLEQRPNGWFSTFEDPDGNLVQVLQLSDDYLASTH